MISKTMVISLAALMAVGAGAPLAQAQQGPAQDQQNYQDQQDHYRNAQAQYQDQTADYAAKRAAYERERRHFEHQRAEYDAQNGAGAFERYYREHRHQYDERYGEGAYDRDFGPSPYSDARHEEHYDAYRDYRDSPCEQRADNHAVAGGLIGALAGAAIGSNLAHGGGRTGGAILGAVAGGAIGASVGHNTAQCDREGYYFTDEQTYPYREGESERDRSGEYGYEYYSSHRCRLAQAPVNYDGDVEYRYVRVCPDDRGRYRITR